MPASKALGSILDVIQARATSAPRVVEGGVVRAPLRRTRIARFVSDEDYVKAFYEERPDVFEEVVALAQEYYDAGNFVPGGRRLLEQVRARREAEGRESFTFNGHPAKQYTDYLVERHPRFLERMRRPERIKGKHKPEEEASTPQAAVAPPPEEQATEEGYQALLRTYPDLLRDVGRLAFAVKQRHNRRWPTPRTTKVGFMMALLLTLAVEAATRGDDPEPYLLAEPYRGFITRDVQKKYPEVAAFFKGGRRIPS